MRRLGRCVLLVDGGSRVARACVVAWAAVLVLGDADVLGGQHQSCAAQQAFSSC
jgi:hypothetical protein